MVVIGKINTKIENKDYCFNRVLKIRGSILFVAEGIKLGLSSATNWSSTADISTTSNYIFRDLIVGTSMSTPSGSGADLASETKRQKLRTYIVIQCSATTIASVLTTFFDAYGLKLDIMGDIIISKNGSLIQKLRTGDLDEKAIGEAIKKLSKIPGVTLKPNIEKLIASELTTEAL